MPSWENPYSWRFVAGKIIYKWIVFKCHVWLPKAIQARYIFAADPGKSSSAPEDMTMTEDVVEVVVNTRIQLPVSSESAWICCPQCWVTDWINNMEPLQKHNSGWMPSTNCNRWVANLTSWLWLFSNWCCPINDKHPELFKASCRNDSLNPPYLWGISNDWKL